MNTVKERPIPFTTEMVKAILDGRKTMTRRVVERFADINGLIFSDKGGGTWEVGEYDGYGDIASIARIKCPYGQVGDKLWVRETHFRFGHWIKNGFTKSMNGF